MKFLIDAQLPARLARWFTAQGYDCIHTTELPNGNRTTDQQITEVADVDDRVVVTKDRDFRDGHLLHRAPRRLWLISTGNITNEGSMIATSLHGGLGCSGDPRRGPVHRRLPARPGGHAATEGAGAPTRRSHTLSG